MYKSIVTIVRKGKFIAYSYCFIIKKKIIFLKIKHYAAIYLIGKPVRVLIMKQNLGILFVNKVFKTKFICALTRAQRIIKFITVPGQKKKLIAFRNFGLMEKCAAYNTDPRSIGRIPCFYFFVILSVFQCGMLYTQ